VSGIVETKYDREGWCGMRIIEKTADRLLAVFAPKATAQACWTCRYVSCGTGKHKFCCPNSICQAVCGSCVPV
jgi:hypothetical protein